MNISVDIEPIISPPLPPPSPPPPSPPPTPSDHAFPPPPPPLCDATKEGITSFSVKKTQYTEVVATAHFPDTDESVMSFNSEDETDVSRQEQWTSEIYKNKQPDVLGGRGAILAARQTGKGALTLLGAGDTQTSANMDNTDDPYVLFPQEQVEGKELCIVQLTLDGVNPMGLQVEGGIGTPLVDKILIADIYGVAFTNGEIEKGDQLMMVNGRSLIGVTEAQARNILQAAENGADPVVKIIIAKGGMLNDEDAITYF